MKQDRLFYKAIRESPYGQALKDSLLIYVVKIRGKNVYRICCSVGLKNLFVSNKFTSIRRHEPSTIFGFFPVKYRLCKNFIFRHYAKALVGGGCFKLTKKDLRNLFDCEYRRDVIMKGHMAIVEKSNLPYFYDGEWINNDGYGIINIVSR